MTLLLYYSECMREKNNRQVAETDYFFMTVGPNPPRQSELPDAEERIMLHPLIILLSTHFTAYITSIQLCVAASQTFRLNK